MCPSNKYNGDAIVYVHLFYASVHRTLSIDAIKEYNIYVINTSDDHDHLNMRGSLLRSPGTKRTFSFIILGHFYMHMCMPQ